MSRLTHLTSVNSTGSSRGSTRAEDSGSRQDHATPISRIREHGLTNWSSRRAFRLRDHSPDHSSLPCRLRSIMTSDNISSMHIAHRNGAYQIQSKQTTSYVVFRPSVNLIKRGSPYIIQPINDSIEKKNSATEYALRYEIGFLPSHDYNKEKSKQHQQLDEFCLRPIDTADISKHRFAFEIDEGKIVSPEIVQLNEIIIPDASIISVKINDSSNFDTAMCGVLSVWVEAKPGKGSWIEVRVRKLLIVI